MKLNQAGNELCSSNLHKTANGPTLSSVVSSLDSSITIRGWVLEIIYSVGILKGTK